MSAVCNPDVRVSKHLHILPSISHFISKVPTFLQFLAITSKFQNKRKKTLKQMRKGRRKRTLRTEELARDVEGFTSHDDDLLAVKQLLCNSAGQATKEVSLAVDDDL